MAGEFERRKTEIWKAANYSLGRGKLQFGYNKTMKQHRCHSERSEETCSPPVGAKGNLAESLVKSQRGILR